MTPPILFVGTLVIASTSFDPSTAIATAGILAGIGGAAIAWRKVGPERTNIVVTYQAQVLDDLQSENKRLIDEKLALISEKADLLERVEALETGIKLEQQKAHRMEDALAQVQRARADDQRRIAALEQKTGGSTA